MGGPCQQGPWALLLAVSRLWITGALRSGGPRSSEDASRHVGHGHTRAPAGSRRRSPHRKPVHGAEDRHPDRFEVAHDPSSTPASRNTSCHGSMAASAGRTGPETRHEKKGISQLLRDNHLGAVVGRSWSSDQRARAWSAARRWSIGRLIVAPRISLSDEQPVFACRSLVGARPRMPGCRPTGFARRRRGSSPRRQS